MFHTLIGHAYADFVQEPALEFGAGFQRTAAHDEGVGIKRVDHFVEEKSEGVGLHAENFLRQRVPFIREAADELGGLVTVHFLELVAGVARKKIGEQIVLDGRERAEGFEVAGAPAIAMRL